MEAIPVPEPAPAARPAPPAAVPLPAYRPCPFCAEQILVEAKICKHCHETLDPVLRAAEERRREAQRARAPVYYPSQPPRYPERGAPRYGGMILGVLGAAVLGLSVLTPLVGLPPLGNANFVQLAWPPTWDNLNSFQIVNLACFGAVAAMAFLSFLLAVCRAYAGLLATGLVAIAALVTTATQLFIRMRQMGEELRDKAGDAAVIPIQWQWGWAALGLGALLILIAAFMPSRSAVPDVAAPGVAEEPTTPAYGGMIFGVLGAGILGLGILAPLVGVPPFGTANLFQLAWPPTWENLQPAQVITLACFGVVAGMAVFSLLLAACRAYIGLLVTGLFAVAAIVTVAVQLFLITKQAAAEAEKAGAPAVSAVQWQWGWALLGAGALLLLIAAFMPSRTRME